MRCSARHPTAGWRCALEAPHEGRKHVPPRLAYHHCHARGCEEAVAPALLMCKRHWFMVPEPLRARVWQTYRVGQCDDRDPSESWHEAADEAIAFIAKAEGLMP